MELSQVQQCLQFAVHLNNREAIFLWKAVHIYVCFELVAVACHGTSKENCKFVPRSNSFRMELLNTLRVLDLALITEPFNFILKK